MNTATIVFLLFSIRYGISIVIKQECPSNEMFRSCSFTAEYTCWESENMSKRVMSLPERLSHCSSGCYCKKGFVRAFPSSSCILAVSCSDRRLQYIISKLPDMLIDF